MKVFDFESLEQELAALERMSDEEICRQYNADSREELIEYVKDWWYLNSEEY
jgi:hypothetical protein